MTPLQRRAITSIIKNYANDLLDIADNSQTNYKAKYRNNQTIVPVEEGLSGSAYLFPPIYHVIQVVGSSSARVCCKW